MGFFDIFNSNGSNDVSKRGVTLNNNNADYLVKSGVLDQEKLNEDTLDIYKDILADNDADESFKQIILHFFIPYQISFYKFIFNNDYYKTPEFTRFTINKRQISPTLIVLMENPAIRALGYPHWFYVAFPDVAWWALQGKGNPIIKREIGSLPIAEVLDGKEMKYSIIKLIIDLYQRHTNNMLECQIFNP